MFRFSQSDVGFIGLVSSLASPTQPVSGMTLWLDADDGATITGSAPVTAWSNKGSAGGSFGEVVNGPALITAGLNGKNTLRFDGTNDILVGGTTLSYRSASAFTMFAVFKAISVGTDNAQGFQNDSILGDVDGAYIALYLRSSNLVGLHNFDGISDQVEKAYTIGNWGIAIGLHDSGSLKLSIDGGSESSVSSGNTTDPGSVNAKLGANYNSSAFSNIEIAELLIYNTVLSAADKSSNLSYLQNKWGL